MSLVWPFRTKDPAQYRRIDQGWDLQGLGPGEEDVLQLGEESLQILDLRQVVVDDVGLVGMVDEIILVVGLCCGKSLQRLDLRHDLLAVHRRLIQLRDVGLCQRRLRLVLRENL